MEYLWKQKLAILIISSEQKANIGIVLGKPGSAIKVFI